MAVAVAANECVLRVHARALVATYRRAKGSEEEGICAG